MTASCLQMPPDTSNLLREAAEWRLLGTLFECPGPGWLEQVSTLAAEVGDACLGAAAAAAPQEASPGLYHTTFGPGGPAAPREVSHQQDVLPGASLAELRSLYQAFAYEPSLDEPPDHVAIEAGFVAYLRFKQAYALAREDEEHARMCADAAQYFIAEHWGRLAEPLAASLASSGIAYLALTAHALRARVPGGPAQPPTPATPNRKAGENE